jgi:ABC-type methionine transport system ATPase subunit
VAIINQGELKATGRVSDLVAQHQSNLEKAFLDIVGYQPRPDGQGQPQSAS